MDKNEVKCSKRSRRGRFLCSDASIYSIKMLLIRWFWPSIELKLNDTSTIEWLTWFCGWMLSVQWWLIWFSTLSSLMIDEFKDIPDTFQTSRKSFKWTKKISIDILRSNRILAMCYVNGDRAEKKIPIKRNNSQQRISYTQNVCAPMSQVRCSDNCLWKNRSLVNDQIEKIYLYNRQKCLNAQKNKRASPNVFDYTYLALVVHRASDSGKYIACKNEAVQVEEEHQYIRRRNIN